MHLLFDPGLLHRVQCLCCLCGGEMLLLCPAVRQTLKGCDFLACCSRGGCNAGTNLFAVEQYGARSALCQTAAELGTGDIQLIAKNVEKRCILGGLYLALLSIDCDR